MGRNVRHRSYTSAAIISANGAARTAPTNESTNRTNASSGRPSADAIDRSIPDLTPSTEAA